MDAVPTEELPVSFPGIAARQRITTGALLPDLPVLVCQQDALLI